MIGATLSHFEITAKLCKGGMGEVYRTTDTKLGREVAIKVLLEAKVLASLNHPDIAAIYPIEAATPAGLPRSSPRFAERG